jgi:hypothetical protein
LKSIGAVEILISEKDDNLLNERSKVLLAPSKMLHENQLEMRAWSVFLNKLSFDSKSTSEYCIKLRND